MRGCSRLADVAIGLLNCLVLPVGALLGFPVPLDDQFLAPMLSLMLDLVTLLLHSCRCHDQASFVVGGHVKIRFSKVLWGR